VAARGNGGRSGAGHEHLGPTPRVDSVVDAYTRRVPGRRQGLRGAHLARTQLEALTDKDLQGLERPAFRGEAHRRRRDLPESSKRAVVFSFEKKMQVQALDRTQPSLPMRAGTMPHDYKRRGIIALFPALDIAPGEVITDHSRRHAGADVLAFFKKIDRQVFRRHDEHVILDSRSAQMGPEVIDWVGEPAQARWHLHFTPTSSSWLNLVKRWFALLTDRRPRRGVFGSVIELTNGLRVWAKHWNDDRKPFIWTKVATRSSRKVRRGRGALHQVKFATSHQMNGEVVHRTLRASVP